MVATGTQSGPDQTIHQHRDLGRTFDVSMGYYGISAAALGTRVTPSTSVVTGSRCGQRATGLRAELATKTL